LAGEITKTQVFFHQEQVVIPFVIRPRWHKVFADLWEHKVRSLLVISSIAVGLFAVGMITSTHTMITEDMRNGYLSVNPANIQINTSPFIDELVGHIKGIEGVSEVMPVYKVSLRVKGKDGDWIAIQIDAHVDVSHMALNKLVLERGEWPTQEGQIAIDRFKLDDLGVDLGDFIEVEAPSGTTRQLEVVGIVHDETIGFSGTGGGFFLAPVQGFIAQKTLSKLEQPEVYNTLFITVMGDNENLDYLREVANRVSDNLENNSLVILSSSVRASDDHPTSNYVDAMAGILFLLGFLVVFLSGFLITNTFQALLNQQVQQIGSMKTIGANQSQIMGIYLVLILIYSAIAFVIAAPTAPRAAYSLLKIVTFELNFNLLGYRPIPLAIVIQLLIAVIVPQAAGFIPVLRGSSLSVQEAISGFVQEESHPEHSLVNRTIGRIKGLSRPLLISLRNTFRRKFRLLLTLVTLTLGGAVFIATFNVRASLERYIEDVSHYYLADVNLVLSRPYRIHEIEYALYQLPEVGFVEGWAQARCEIVLEDGSMGDSAALIAPPAGSPLVQPVLVGKGRWIQTGDQNAVALSERFIDLFPDMKIGDTIRFRVNDKETEFVVVGFFQLAGKSAGYLAYTDYEFLSTITHQTGLAASYRIVAKKHDLTLAEQKDLARTIQEHLDTLGIIISDVTAGQYIVERTTNGLNILTFFLLILALLTALVGSIGLTGTMSLNVMERIREIGILRAIGAADRSIMNLVIGEGMIIGILSWLLGTLFAFPISKILSETLSQALFSAPSRTAYSPVGFGLWLGVVIILSVVASVMPARSAAKLTIREVLAYE
jgi:putative ABC transport system permease protein